MRQQNSLMRHIPDGEVIIVEGEFELQAIRRLRYAVYVKEQGKQLPWSDHMHCELAAPGDESAIHFAIFEGGEPLCAARLQLTDVDQNQDLMPIGLQKAIHKLEFSPAIFSKLVVRRDRRGLNWTRQLLAAVYRVGRERGAIYSIGHCHPRLVSWYESMGMRVAGPQFRDPHVGIQVPMLIIGDDLAHFRSKSSFLAVVAQQFQNDPVRASHIASVFEELNRNS